MKIHLVTHTNEPLKAIAIAQGNIGIGRDIAGPNDISYEEASELVGDMLKSFLGSPLEFASFNLFWQDVPIFIVRELVRHRIGWSYAERSLRFYDVAKEGISKPLEDFDESKFISVYEDLSVPEIDNPEDDKEWSYAGFRQALYFQQREQMEFYSEWTSKGVPAQDVRLAIGVWYPTDIQTACTYRALRDMLALRLSSQAHPGWKDVAQQIKALVTEVDPILGGGLTDICEIQKRCVWYSKLDRPCEDCARRGRDVNHVHDFSNGQCTCGEVSIG